MVSSHRGEDGAEVLLGHALCVPETTLRGYALVDFPADFGFILSTNRTGTADVYEQKTIHAASGRFCADQS